MEPLGIIGGSAFVKGGAPAGAEERRVGTDRGEVPVWEGDGYVFLRRHGQGGYQPPHGIPHHAHALALEALGVKRVVALCSVGALHARYRPGTVLVPDDYLTMHPPPTFAGEDRLHIIPRLDRTLRAHVLKVARAVADRDPDWGRASTESPARSDVKDGGVYAQTHGPRFETRAEIRMLAQFADVVGMTAASEATLLQERGIGSAIICVVDNYAHGIGARPLTLEAFDEQLEKNRHRVQAILDGLIAGERT